MIVSIVVYLIIFCSNDSHFAPWLQLNVFFFRCTTEGLRRHNQMTLEKKISASNLNNAKWLIERWQINNEKIILLSKERIWEILMAPFTCTEANDVTVCARTRTALLKVTRCCRFVFLVLKQTHEKPLGTLCV